MFEVNGRGLKTGVVSVTPTAGGLTIRVDDEERPEFWLELKLPTAQLTDWLMRSRMVAEYEEIESAGESSNNADSQAANQVDQN